MSSKPLFIAEPMGDKSVTEISGVTPALALRMSDRGVTKAYQLLGRFLVFKMNTALFVAFIKQEFKATRIQADLIHDDISEWVSQFL